MPKVNEREYREFRSLEAIVREEGNEDYMVEGYATTFDQPYELFKDWDGNPFYEVIDRHAFDEADMSDFIFQLNHQGTPLARNRNNTLSAFADEHGLFIKANLKGCAAGRECHESILNGLIDRMSFGFTVADGGWEYDSKTNTNRITKIAKLYDVSAVTFPANDNTEISARDYINGAIEACHRKECAERLDTEERERLALSLELLK